MHALIIVNLMNTAQIMYVIHVLQQCLIVLHVQIRLIVINAIQVS